MLLNIIIACCVGAFILYILYKETTSTFVENVAPDEWRVQCDMKITLNDTIVRVNKDSLRKHLKNKRSNIC